MDWMMNFPGFSGKDRICLNSVMDAGISDVLADNLEVTLEVIAERFAMAALDGERDLQRLKALTLGAEKAPSGSDLHPAN